MSYELPSSSTWNTHSYGSWHTHQHNAAKRGTPGFLPSETDMQLELQVGDHRCAPGTVSGHREAIVLLITTLFPPMTAWLLITSNGVCVSRAGGVTWICPKLIFPASPLPEPQQQSLGKGGDTRYPRVFLVKTSTWVCRRKSKTVWHARQINFYALPAVTSPSRHGGCFLWRV